MVRLLPEDGAGRLTLNELVDRLGWIAARLKGIKRRDDALVVRQAAVLLKRWQLSSEQQEFPADPADPGA
jgi:hypothetical protein